MVRGGAFLEAPVCGSRVPALEGQLLILASGDRKLFDDCYSCFEAMGKKSFYLGSESRGDFCRIASSQGWAASGFNLISGCCFFFVENVIFSSAIVAYLHFRFFFLSLCLSLFISEPLIFKKETIIRDKDMK